MIVRFKIKHVSELKNLALRSWLIKYVNDDDVLMDISRTHVVYGIIFYENHPFYYLCTDLEEDYPCPYPAAFFEILDSRLSKYWQLSYRYEESKAQTGLLFENWAGDSMFYEKLIDGSPDEVKIFTAYRKLIDVEFNGS